MRHKTDPTLVGLDLNAMRARALAGAAGTMLRPLALDGDHTDLPLFLSLERRQIEVGRAGFAVCRRLPHLVCSDFLAALGSPHVWKAGRHSVDAAQASTFVLKHLATHLPEAHAVGLAVPGYLTRPQAVELSRLAEATRLPLACSVAAPLAAALSAMRHQASSGPLMVLDADQHALTFTLVVPHEDRVQVLDRESCAQLGLSAWRERVLDTIADRCIRRSRRDPRASSEAEQALWEQLDSVFAACARGRLADVSIQAGQWYQDLVLRPEEVVTCTARLTAQALEAVRHMLHRAPCPAPRTLVLTAAAGRLPGLLAALQETLDQPPREVAKADSSDDFGENLLQAPTGETTLTVLPEDAIARVAWELAATAQRGHLDVSSPLLAVSRPPDPARRLGTRA